MRATDLLAASSLASLSGTCLSTAFIAARRSAPLASAPTERVAVSVVRPCDGAEPELAASLRPPDDWTHPFESLACVGHRDDPAMTIAREARAVTVVDDPSTADWKNPKTRHLEAGLRRATHDTVIFADADARLDAPLLDALLAALETPGVAAAFAPPMAASGASWGHRLLRAALGGSLYAWPALVSLTRALGQPIPMSGALVAFRKAALDREALASAAHAIADDLALATALQRRGRLVMIDRPVICARGEIPAPAAVATLRRWVHVAGLDAPWRLLGFPVLFCASWLLLALLPATLALPTALAIPTALLMLAALGARVWAANKVRARLLGERVALLDLFAVEAVLLDAAWRAAVAVGLGRELRWRRRLYRVGRGGRILSVRSAA